MEDLLAAKEQIVICNSAVDEAIALQFLERRERFLPALRAHVAHNHALLLASLARQPWLEWVAPEAAVVMFPRFRADVPVDSRAFYRILLEDHATVVGPGHWFDMDDRYLRIGFGYPSEEAMRGGLAGLEQAAPRATSPPV
jgi:DNA-binding transcriptional MocR family regulator